jgi:hypothetical protein
LSRHSGRGAAVAAGVVEEQVVNFAVAAAVGEDARGVGVGAEVLICRPVDLVVLLLVDHPVRDRDRQVVPAGLLLDADREPERAAEPDVGEPHRGQ